MKNIGEEITNSIVLRNALNRFLKTHQQNFMDTFSMPMNLQICFLKELYFIMELHEAKYAKF